jgi:hypothetical protein
VAASQRITRPSAPADTSVWPSGGGRPCLTTVPRQPQSAGGGNTDRPLQARRPALPDWMRLTMERHDRAGASAHAGGPLYRIFSAIPISLRAVST